MSSWMFAYTEKGGLPAVASAEDSALLVALIDSNVWRA